MNKNVFKKLLQLQRIRLIRSHAFKIHLYIHVNFLIIAYKLSLFLFYFVFWVVAFLGLLIVVINYIVD